jgi:SAM-dependent methyltransferase
MTTESKGLPIRGLGSRFYDLGTDLCGFGRKFAQRIVQEAALKPGGSVLDCGCGTGTLAIAARRAVGPEGRVYGIDISKEQLDQAKRKIRGEDLRIDFSGGSVDELPFMFMCLIHSTGRGNLFSRLPELMTEASLHITEEKTIKEVVHLIKAT